MRYNQNEKKAHEKGYRIDDDGKVTGLRGQEIGSYSQAGYKKFKIRSDSSGKELHVNAHRLQAYQKYGEKIYESGTVVRHLDNDKTNNTKDNIGIGSYSDNCMDQPKEVRVARAKHASSFITKYNKEDVKKFHNEHGSYNKTMEHFNISSKGTLHHILNK